MTDRATRFTSRIHRKAPPWLTGPSALTARGAAPPG